LEIVALYKENETKTAIFVDKTIFAKVFNFVKFWCDETDVAFVTPVGRRSVFKILLTVLRMHHSCYIVDFVAGV